MGKVSAGEYQERATECQRLAADTVNKAVRETLLYFARRWGDFAVTARGEENTALRDTMSNPMPGAAVDDARAVLAAILIGGPVIEKVPLSRLRSFVERRVAESEARIVRLEAILRELERCKQTEAADIARRCLGIMRQSLERSRSVGGSEVSAGILSPSALPAAEATEHLLRNAA